MDIYQQYNSLIISPVYHHFSQIVWVFVKCMLTITCEKHTAFKLCVNNIYTVISSISTNSKQDFYHCTWVSKSMHHTFYTQLLIVNLLFIWVTHIISSSDDEIKWILWILCLDPDESHPHNCCVYFVLKLTNVTHHSKGTVCWPGICWYATQKSLSVFLKIVRKINHLFLTFSKVGSSNCIKFGIIGKLV